MALTSVSPEDIYSINSRQHLALVNDVMRRRTLDRLMSDGVTIVDPANTWIDARADRPRHDRSNPFVHPRRRLRIGGDCRVGPFAHLVEGTTVPAGATGRPLGRRVAMTSMRIFAGRSCPLLAEEIAQYLGFPLGRVQLEDFPDGEIA
jgi:bifunctional N-acetylglucosamine-1-phosphate-uridyltransferase/glucosamine-1-phosphate-acetyltransferase GlmU-like protein